MVVLDWRDRSHWGGGRRLPCIHCGRFCFLLDDAGRPAHKSCVEAAVDAQFEHDRKERNR